MFGTLSRRDFLKGAAAFVAALSVSSWFPLPRRAAGQSSPLPVAPGFTPLPSQLATGAPIADIAAGWDGTLWAVDALGVAHVYDPLQQQWAPFGRGVDAATVIGNDFYLFRGSEVAVYNIQTGLVSLQPISQVWPGLQLSFTSDLDGAFANGSLLYLCRGGRYVFADLSSTPVSFSQPTPLNTWPGWSPNDPWGQGIVAKTATWIDDRIGTAALFFPVQTPPEEYAYSYLVQGGSAVTQAISQLGAFIPQFLSTPMADLLTSDSFDGYVAHTTTDNVTYSAWVFAGPIIWSQSSSDQGSGPAVAAALATWVPSWEPALRQAPRGRVGNLWSVTTAGAVVFHDGEQWNPAPALPGATVLGVDVGADGVPYLLASGAGGAALYLFDAASATWQAPLPLGGIDAQQVAVGDQTRIFVLDSSGNGYKYDAGGFIQVLTGAAHLSANHDGTVWHSDGSANAFRFISERAYPSQALPAASAVQKVASTAYGNAMLLTNQGGAQQLYHYDSPYVFKTSPSFVPIVDGTVGENPQVAAGGGRCFVNLGSGIVALDNHTGVELWSRQLPNQGECKSIVYDRNHRLLFASDSNQTLFALDAATGEERWFFEAASAPISQPALRGGGLCIVGNNVVYWLDINAALAQGTAQSAAPTWQTTLNTILTENGVLDPALVQIAADTIYVTLNNNSNTRSSGQEVWSLSSGDGSGAQDLTSGPPAGILYVPVITNSIWNGVEGLSVFSNRGVSMMVSSISQPGVYGIMTLPNNATFAPGLTVYQNTLFAGGSDGNLYGLDLTQDLGNDPPFQPVAQLGPSNQTSFGAGPVTIHTSQGDVIAFSTNSNNVGSIWLYAPPAPTPQPNGALVQLETDHLVATQMTMDTDGILYATGSDPADNTFGQVYAIRIDTLLQQERAFIVDSELMQDFDEPAAGQLTATARYQTHVTVVDPNKAPQPFQAVKVWADQATTVLIDGVSYAIDATTAASVQTDATGTLTIVSDATDLSTPSLKLWAGFMNPYERIVVYPDREFHNRLATTHYASGSTNPDPTRINLATATTYDVNNLTSPPTLFTQNDQLEQQKAQAAAQVIQQMTASVGYQKGVTPGPTRRLRSSADTPPLPFTTKYLAYADLAGAAYGPVNLPAKRAVTVLAPTGFSIEVNADNTITAQPNLAVADAADAIDALNGFLYIFTLDYSFLDTLNNGVITPELQAAFQAQGWPLPLDAAIQNESTNLEWGITTWGGQLAAFLIQNEDNALNVYNPPAPASHRSLGSSLRHLWDKIKSGVAKVGKLVVSIGKDIYLGLKYIENGFEKIVRVVLHDIEDFAIAIGSIFVQLGKDIVKAAEALSVIFHLGAVLATADMLKRVFTTMVGNLATFATQAETQINTFFASAESYIDEAFSNIIAELDGATMGQLFARAATAGIGDLQGMGATPHTMFKVGPQGAPATSSQAVPAMWGIHKLRQNYRQATTPSVGAAPSNPLTTFVQGFFAEPNNASQLKQFNTNFASSGLSFKSPKEFFASLLADMLNDLKTLVLDLLGLVQGLLDGMLDGVDYLAEMLGALGEVQIPILSTLWKALTGNTLTFLDVIAFVIAIPVTLVYRIVEGAYPTAPSTRSGTIDTALWQNVEGLASATVTLLSGIFTAILDAEGISSAWADGKPLVIDIINMVSLALGQGFSLVLGDVLQPDFFVVTASVIQLILVVLNAIPVIPPEVPSSLGTCASPVLLWLYYEEFKPQETVEIAKLGFSASVISTFATLINPIKFAPAESLVPYVAPVADAACGFAAAGLTLAATIKAWDAPGVPTALPEGEEPGAAHRVFMPAILQGR